MTTTNSRTIEARRTEILNRLRYVIDPELGLDIVTLGLVYHVVFESNEAMVEMTLTAPGCPMQGPILDGVRRVLGDITWLETIRVRLVWDPPWTPNQIQQ